METGVVNGWNPQASFDVGAMAISGNTVYVGGQFTSVGGRSQVGIAALDATTGLATPWSPSVGGAVLAIAVSGNTVYVGGEFTAQGHENLCALSPRSGAVVNWVGTANGTVFAIDVGTGLVQAGGEFTTVDGRPHRFYARFATQELLSAPGELAHPDIELRAPFPNPAHSESQLRFELPSAERVTLSLLDVQGRRAQSLLEGQRVSAGVHALPLRLDHLAPGLYFCRLQVAGAVRQRKLLVMH